MDDLLRKVTGFFVFFILTGALLGFAVEKENGHTVVWNEHQYQLQADAVRINTSATSETEQALVQYPAGCVLPLAAVVQGDNMSHALYVLFADSLWKMDLASHDWTPCSTSIVLPDGAGLLAYGVNHLVVGSSGTIGWLYHTVTDTWTPAEGLSGIPLRVEGDSVVFLNSADEEEHWSPRIKPVFGWVNYLVLFGYLIVILALGGGLSRKGTGASGFFKAGGHVPWWVSALSIFGAQISAISYMAIPAKTYSMDWRYMAIYISIIMVLPLVVFVFLPFFRRLQINTAYEYLEMRFNRTVRCFGSLMFVLLQVCKIAVVLFLPSIALNVVTGVNVYFCILIMGVLCLAYTTAGGMGSIVWVEALQVLILLGGAVLCLGILMAKQGGLFDFYAAASAEGKLRAFDFRWDLNTPSFWAVLFGAGASTLIQYGSDQGVIQRYLTTKDEKAAAKSIWMNSAMAVPAAVLFFSIGTGLYLYYQSHPAHLDPGMTQADAIFPWYMVTQLPVGVAGLLIAGIFAAAQSTLSSSVNAAATAVTMDFYRTLRPDDSDRSRVRFARWMTLVLGALGIGIAMLMAGWDIKSLWDQLGIYIGLFSSGLTGLFLLGMLTRRANGAGALTGLLVSAAVVWWVKDNTPIFFMLYALVGIVVAFVVGYVVSMLTGGSRKDLTGLSVHTQRTEDK